MSYSLNYSIRYFGLYLWFAFVMCILIGIPWEIVATLTGWDVFPDATFKEISVNQLVSDGVLFFVSLIVFSIACKWSLEKTIQHDYKLFKMLSSREKIKFNLALVSQLQVVACSFIAKYVPAIFGFEISESSQMLVDLLVLFVSNYVIVIRWIAHNTTITTKDLKNT